MDYLKDNTIIICENNTKISLLKELTNSFLNIKFYTKKEFLDNYLFKYDEKTIYYLISKYSYKIDVCKMYLYNLKYIDINKVYKSNKLNYLVNLKKELDANNLLIYNNEFEKELKGYSIIVLNYLYLDNYEIDIFNKLKASIINNKGNYKIEKVYACKNDEEEIDFVCKKICELIHNNVDINKIKIMGIDSSYYNNLLRISNFYNLPINIPSNNSLISNSIVKIFLNNLNKGLDNAIESIIDEDENIVNKVISICNKYVNLNDDEIKYNLIIEDLKNTKINNFNYKNYIDIIDFNDYVNDNEYIFLMNFNNGVIPSIIKDENYITDNIKDEVNLKTTTEINKEIKVYQINKLLSIKNLVITYKKADSKGECYPSSLIKELNIKEEEIDNNILESYSYDLDSIKLCICEDKYHKYGIVTDDYLIYKNNLKDIKYNTYDNKYKGIDKNILLDYLNNKLTLSYSTISNYYKCGFRYYLTNILKLDKYEDSFEAFIGSIFHDVLEKCFKDNLNIEEEINNYVKEKGRILTIKERFYLHKIKADIEFVINILNKQNNYIGLDQTLYEQNIVLEKENNVKFIGFIDKLLYKEENDKTYVAIIDYKTGNVDTNLELVPYGLNLQLPIYLYLVSKSHLFNNIEFVGFYIQYILSKDIKKIKDKTCLDQYEDNLKLVGYSNSSVHTLSLMDNTYEKSMLIKSMSIKQGGNFSSNAKVLSNDKINNLINETEKIIDKGIKEILDGKFDINPKQIEFAKEIEGCKYCKFKDICFKKEKDIVMLKKGNLDYLGGEEDA